MSALPGNPAVLTDRAADLVRSADVIAEVIEDLRRLVVDDKAQAIEALHQRSTSVADDLDRIHGRYDGTARAITDYAVELTDAHAKADAAQEDLDEARSRQVSALGDLQFWKDKPDGSDPSLRDRIQSAWAGVQAADGAVDDAQDRLDDARRQMNEAAEDAISRIENAISDTNEGWLDKIGEFFEDVGDFFEKLADWVGDFLADVWNELQRIAATLTALLDALALLAAFVLIAFAIFGTGGLVVALLAAGLFAAFVAASIASDVLKGTPKVDAVDPYEDLPRGRPDQPTLDTVLNGTTEVDGLGGEDESVVKLTKRLGPDGWYWTVTLPSTQEWLSRFGDKGAVNDLDSNLALMMTPELRTQYERAVLDAMEQAGVGPDDHVMLVGFSQGGIMAGHLAAYNSDYNWDAVVVSGAPIDHMPIPSSVDVVSVQHTGDPVPRLDSLVGDGAPHHGSNWTTIAADPPHPSSTLGVDVGAHNSRKYSQTYQNAVDKIRHDHPRLDNYFGHDGVPSVSSYYHWKE